MSTSPTRGAESKEQAIKMADYRSTIWRTRIAIAIVFIAAAGAAAYFLVIPKSEKPATPAEIVANVKLLTQDELPVHVITGPGFGGLSGAPELQNASGMPLALRVTVRRPRTNEQHQWQLEVKPNQMLNLAGQGGWTFAAGDELELVKDGYRPRKVTLQ